MWCCFASSFRPSTPAWYMGLFSDTPSSVTPPNQTTEPGYPSPSPGSLPYLNPSWSLSLPKAVTFPSIALVDFSPALEPEPTPSTVTRWVPWGLGCLECSQIPKAPHPGLQGGRAKVLLQLPQVAQHCLPGDIRLASTHECVSPKQHDCTSFCHPGGGELSADLGM